MSVALLENTFSAVIKADRSTQKRFLTVEGDVDASAPGWRVDLVRAQPQGINREVLLLQLVAEPPDHEGSRRVVRMHVKFDEEIGDTIYHAVTISDKQTHQQVDVKVSNQSVTL